MLNTCVICEINCDESDGLFFNSEFYCSLECGNLNECDECNEVYSIESGISLSNYNQNFCSSDCLESAGYVECESDNCSNYVFESDCLTSNDSRNFCDSSCAEDEGYQKCEHCDEFFEESEGEFVSVDDYYYCSSDCRIESGYEKCYGCDEFFSSSNGEGVFINDELYCSADCAGAKMCDRCSKYEIESDGLVLKSGEFYCSFDCAEREDVCACENCNELYAYSDGVNINNSNYCDADCADASLCYGCDNYFKNEDLKEFCGEVYCSTDCAEAVECSNCFDYVLEEDAITCDQYHYCSGECAEVEGNKKCECCEKYFDEDILILVEDGEERHLYCSDCGYVTCESCGNGFSTHEEFAGDNIGVSGRFCSVECAKGSDDMETCEQCNKLVDVSDGIEVDNITFCSENCLENYGYIKSNCCGTYLFEDDALKVKSNSVISFYCKNNECLSANGIYKCNSCKKYVINENSSVNDKFNCEKCSSELNGSKSTKGKSSAKELYESSYTLDNIVPKISLSNSLYMKKLDKDKISLISKKHVFLRENGFFMNVNLLPYNQKDLGKFSFMYKVINSENYFLINLSSVILVKGKTNEVIEILDLSKSESDKDLLNHFISGGHLELDLINVLNDDRRSPKVYLDKIKEKYTKKNRGR